MNSTTYGIGGYDPEHLNGNVIEQTIDNGNGTGTRTTYHPDGTVDTVEQLAGLPYEPRPLPVDALRDITDIRDTTPLRSPR